MAQVKTIAPLTSDMEDYPLRSTGLGRGFGL